jgi:glycine cleavage system transcriptional repressor
MAKTCFMCTVVGRDQPGIVASITRELLQAQANLGESTMMRLGGNFTIMMMVDFAAGKDALFTLLQSVANKLSLKIHIDAVVYQAHDHPVPNTAVTVHGADRVGIVAEITERLYQAGFNITHLESQVGGAENKPLYVMQIEGQAEDQSADSLRVLLEDLDSVSVRVNALETLIG